MDSGGVCRVQPVWGATLFVVLIVSEFDPVRQHCHVHGLPVRAPVAARSSSSAC